MSKADFDFSQSYFDLFEVDENTVPDANSLRERFMVLQRSYHPDRFATASDAEKRFAMQVTSFVNEAYNVLCSPIERSAYQLQRHGIDVGAETDARMDSGFLMEQMELREDLENVEHADNPMAELESFRDDLDQKVEAIAQQNATEMGQQDFDKARESFRRWQFLEKLGREASELEAKIDEANARSESGGT